MLESSLIQPSLHSCCFTDYKEEGFVSMNHFHLHHHRSRAYIQSEISSLLTCIRNQSLLGAALSVQKIHGIKASTRVIPENFKRMVAPL